MENHTDIPGYFAPVHRAVIDPILLAGAPRTIAIANGTLLSRHRALLRGLSVMALDTLRTLRLVAFGVGGLAALAAAFELTRTILPEEGHVVADSALRSTLARCRDLTPEDYATDTECRAAWEAARQRFFDLAPEPAGTE